MAKERLVEQYGEIRFTIGTGCSGGSLTQQQVANAYPGIYQGILPACSFPDGWSTGQQLVDYHLVRRYVENPSLWGTGVAWTPDADRRGGGTPQPRQLDRVRHGVLDLARRSRRRLSGRAGRAATTTPQTNPGGVRCVLADYMINVLGPRPASVWIPAEQQVGHGFGGLPLDNVGVQYGLEALRNGTITTAQFVDLNAKIGGAEHRQRLDPRTLHGRRAARSRTPTAAAGSTARTTSTRSRSSTSAGPTRERSTTPTDRLPSVRGSSASTARSQTRRSGTERCR